jgi:hypothetical protein
MFLVDEHRGVKMMHYDKFVVAVKAGSKFLRDEDGVVKLPFGQDYSLYLKNLNSRDAVVSVSIDGNDVLGGNQLVVRANSTADLLGFMEGNSVKNAFRFIELTKELEEKLGYSPEDSLIRCEITYRKEKPITQIVDTVYRYNHWDWQPRPYIWYGGNTFVSRGSSCGASDFSDNGNMTKSVSCYGASASLDGGVVNTSFRASDVGITVKGQECNQNFGTTYINDLEDQSHVLVLRLSGYKDDNTKVETVVGSQEKLECPTCGLKNENKSKFCANCGTFLR